MSAKHILVVEDNFDNQQLVTWILEDEEYQVTCAGTAEEGLEKLNQIDFDAVLMDISLPGMDGKQATQEIRKNPNKKDIPVIALTAHAVLEEREEILACGVDDMLTKPVDEEALVRLLKEKIK